MPELSEYRQRKLKRIDNFEKNIKGWKLRTCVACNGSGRYDSSRRPRCGACGGTGKERYLPTGTAQ